MMIDVVVHDVDEIKLRCFLHKLMITDKLVVKHVKPDRFYLFNKEIKAVNRIDFIFQNRDESNKSSRLYLFKIEMRAINRVDFILQERG